MDSIAPFDFTHDLDIHRPESPLVGGLQNLDSSAEHRPACSSSHMKEIFASAASDDHRNASSSSIVQVNQKKSELGIREKKAIFKASIIEELTKDYPNARPAQINKMVKSRWDLLTQDEINKVGLHH